MYFFIFEGKDIMEKKYGNWFVILWLKKGIHLLGVIFIFFFIF